MKELAEGCRIISVPADVEVRRRAGAVFCQPLVWKKDYGLHEHTIAEEHRTLVNRHLFATPDPEIGSVEWGELRRQIRLLGKQIGKVPRAPFAAILKTKDGRKKKRYWGGINKYQEFGISGKDTRITMMPKLELYEEEKILVKEDRGIQYRSTQYNAALARQLWNIEHRLIHLHDGPNRMVMKGLQPDERFRHILCGTETFKDPVFFLLDHSRFDAHVNPALLALEHSVYRYCRRGNPELKRLLRWQEKNCGYSFGGIKYAIKGKRMSGDVNTSLGNTILNLCMLRAWLRHHRVRGKIFLDGDDSVVVVEREASVGLRDFAGFFEKLGMVTEGEMVEDFWKVEFCQSRPVWIDGQVRACRDPLKVISTVGICAGSHDDQTMREIVAATCKCEFALNGMNMPVVSPYVHRVFERTRTTRNQLANSWRYKAEFFGLNWREDVKFTPDVSEESRYWFWRTWGITPGEQLMMEHQYIKWQEIVTVHRKDLKIKQVEYPLVWDTGHCCLGCDCNDCPEFGPERCELAVRRFL